MTVRILQGDCREVLTTLPDESVHCVVTSPPYWGLRDYGVDGQIGLEDSPINYVAELVAVFSEVRRVMRADGTVWLNLGDSYANTGGADRRASLKSTIARSNGKSRRVLHDAPSSSFSIPAKAIPTGLKPKDLCGVPWRVALALQADGWWLRQDIIWAKPNPMPESVTDRCTKAHEYIFLLAKSERYYFDTEAIQEAATGEAPGNTTHKYVTAYEDGNETLRTKAGLLDIGARDKRNKRSVWHAATASYSDAHFATFPADLIEPCILAGCPEGGTVLDPFGGAGTTGLVADRHQRNAILIELNPQYAEMARKRIFNDAPLFADVA